MKKFKVVLIASIAASLAVGCTDSGNSAGNDDALIASVADALFTVEGQQFALAEDGGEEAEADAQMNMCARIGGPVESHVEGDGRRGDGHRHDGDGEGHRPPMGGADAGDDHHHGNGPRGERASEDGHDGHARRQDRGHKEGKGRKGRAHGKRMDVLKFVYDADNDGQLSDDERATLNADLTAGCEARFARLLEQYDADNNGELSDEEKAQIQADKAEQRAAHEAEREARKAAALAEFDADGDGELNAEERAQAKEAHEAEHESRLETFTLGFDADGDGELNDDERAAMVEFVRTRVQNGEPVIEREEE